jgi:hypothetical protein
VKRGDAATKVEVMVGTAHTVRELKKTGIPYWNRTTDDKAAEFRKMCDQSADELKQSICRLSRVSLNEAAPFATPSIGKASDGAHQRGYFAAAGGEVWAFFSRTAEKWPRGCGHSDRARDPGRRRGLDIILLIGSAWTPSARSSRGGIGHSTVALTG